MSCNDKLKQRCTKTEANCTMYRTELPSFSELTDCVTIEETTEELYNLVSEIKENVDLTNLTYDCGTLPTDRSVESLIQFFLDRDCAQQETIETMQTMIDTMQQQIEDLQTNTCP